MTAEKLCDVCEDPAVLLCVQCRCLVCDDCPCGCAGSDDEADDDQDDDDDDDDDDEADDAA